MTTSSVVSEIEKVIPEQYEIWHDVEKMRPGDHISTSTEHGLTGSDYFLRVISEEF
jgi:hypothetical protein